MRKKIPPFPAFLLSIPKSSSEMDLMQDIKALNSCIRKKYGREGKHEFHKRKKVEF